MGLVSTIRDWLGRPVRPEALKGPPQAAATFGALRSIYSQFHPDIALTPQKLAGILRQSEMGDPLLALELFERMEEKDLHYLSVIGTRKQTVAQLELDVKPAGDDAQSKADADFVREVLVQDGSLDLQSSLADLSDAIGKGFAVAEINWEDGSDGSGGLHWLPTRVTWRDPRWFMFDWIGGALLLVRTWRTPEPIDAKTAWTEQGWELERGSLIQHMSDLSAVGIQPATAPLAPYKFITHIAKAKSGLPIRGGLSRAAAWIYLFKNYVLKDWVTYTERYGMPARLGKYPSGATEDDKNRLLEACAQLGSDSAAICPESMMISLIEASKSGSRSGASVFLDPITYFDDCMSKAVLGQTLTTQLSGKGGSRAAAEVHDNVRKDILQWDCVRLGGTLSRDLARPLVHLNRGERLRYPRIAIKIATGADKLWMETVGIAADHGVKIGQDAVRDQLGLPAPLPGEELLTPKQTITGSAPSPDDNPTEPAPKLLPSPVTSAITGAVAFSEPPDPFAGAEMRRHARVIVIEEGRLLVIQQRGEPYVMVPGGHLDAEESFRDAALRETREETGLEVELVGWLGDFIDARGYRRYYAGRRTSPVPFEHLPTLNQDGDGSGLNDVVWLPVDEAPEKLTSEYDRAALEKCLHEQAETVSAAAAQSTARRPRPAARTEVYAARMAGRWNESIGPWLHQVQNFLVTAHSLPDARDRLHQLVDAIDSSVFEEQAQRAMFNVRAAADQRARLP